MRFSRALLFSLSVACTEKREESAVAVPPPPSDSQVREPVAIGPFRLPEVGPVFPELANAEDGRWVALADERGTAVFMTTLHPDKRRAFALAHVFAFDLRQLTLEPVAGTAEPRTDTAEGAGFTRSGRVPARALSHLFVAFTGAASDGSWGMRVDGVTIASRRASGCVLAPDPASGGVRLAPTPPEQASVEPGGAWWRETGPCAYVDGVAQSNPLAADDAAADRAALGHDASGATLFVGFGEVMTASAMAGALRHAGAVSVAPLAGSARIAVFSRDPNGALTARVPLSRFPPKDGEFVDAPSAADFFCLSRR
ncbi:MAG: hypothetical protein U0271_08285 [Polyangiaceae bacterium]